jgi:NAD(P)H-hydrate epimerase
MRALDADTIQRLGIPGAVLMESAGRGVVNALWSLHNQGVLDLYSHQVVVVAGPGNNGGDGMVVARYLHSHGVAVRVCLCVERERVRGDSLLHLQATESCGTSVTSYSGEAGVGQVAALLQRLSRRDVIIDALLGTGLKRAVTGPLGHVIEAINLSPAVKVAVDLPSGLDADSGVPLHSDGEIPSTPLIVRADYTVTLGQPKIGLCGAPGFIYAGAVFVVDIGIPESLCGRLSIRGRLLDERCLLRLGQPRNPLGHKGSHGHLLIVAGSRGKGGAALLCTRAALATGVGLCTLAAPAEVLSSLFGGSTVEAMSYPYSMDALDRSVLDKVPDKLSEQLLRAAEAKQALAIGPGLPVEAPMKQALLELLARGTAPMVLDADALNLLAPELPSLRAATRAGQTLVLTPHPGEASRLLGRSTAEVQADRTSSARQLCQLTGAVVVLKGARTVIVAPDAESGELIEDSGDSGNERTADRETSVESGGPLSISPTGNAGMGSGGMGDVLTGMVGALLTAGWPAYEAACAGVYWHGLAGDLLEKRRAPGSVLLAGDLIDTLDAARKHALQTAQTRSGRSRWPITSL